MTEIDENFPVESESTDGMILQQYIEFLDDEQDQGKYHERVNTMIEDLGIRLMININDLRKKKPQRAISLLKNAAEELSALQKAVKEYVMTVNPTYGKEHEEFFIGFEGSFGNKHVTPRTLTARFLGNLVCVEGIITKCSLSKLKMVRSVHYCSTTGKFVERKYTDLTSTDAFPSGSVYPTKDDAGNLLETEFGLSQYKDHQTLTIQEMPEKAPAGQLPRSIDIICDNDLVDICKPGDRVQIVGCYRPLPGKHGGFTSGIFRTVILCNSISQVTTDSEMSITTSDLAIVKKLAKQPDIFGLLARSLAPSIHGHDYVKRAILCLLLGGSEKILENGTRLRGDINILLIGDPSVAKSQLLRYVIQTAPRAVATTGRGSSGVGLTAAVTTDPETGERRLEAGAMILADRGVVCIDEFDKMTDIDRTAIHEVMEQGKVTIAKAGIHARLNARCSVLAAANPVYGRYDQYKTPMENIGLQDSLLSRFDLLFVLLDLVDAEDDGRIAEHVVRMHRYRSPAEQDGGVLMTDIAADLLATRTSAEDEEEVEVFEKYDPLLHGRSRSAKDKIISMKFMKKYIKIVKIAKPPVLSEEACEIICEEYSRLRSQDTVNSEIARTQPITARTLETMIRLSTAHAKVRWSRTVDAEDANAAIDLVQFAIFRKVLQKTRKRLRHQDESEEELEGDIEEGAVEPRTQRQKRTRRSSQDEFSEIDSQEDGAPSLQELRQKSAKERRAATAQADISPERLETLKEGIFKVFQEGRDSSLPLSQVTTYLNEMGAAFTEGELEAGMSQLSADNKIMISDNTVFLI